MEWLFQHMEDPDIDAPLDLGGSGGVSADPEKIEMIGAMGFTPPQARKALRETGGDIERAVDWLFNHPDDQGDVDSDGGAADTAASLSKELAGSNELPARFQLRSIVCHKGTSIHAGYVHLIPTLTHKGFTNIKTDIMWLLFAKRLAPTRMRRRGFFTMTKRWSRSRMWRR
jgi:uncharacterized UBP type Zn finger protein